MRKPFDRRPTRIAGVALAGMTLLVALGVPQTSHAARGGSVLYGGFTGVGCDWSAHCTAFRQSCLPDLAIGDGFDTSIVDIPVAYRNTNRTFRPTAPSSTASSRAFFSYYDSVCRLISGGVGVHPGVRIGTSYTTKVPSAARWISVHGYQVTQMSWTLS